MVRELFADPETFFDEKFDFGRLRPPAIIVLIAGFAYALPDLAVGLAFGETRSEIEVGLLIMMITSIVTVIALWGVLTVAFYVLAFVMGGQRRIGKLLRLVGWGFLPFIGAGIVWGLTRYYVLLGISTPSPEELSIVDVGDEQAAIDAYSAQASGDPVYLAGTFVGLLFVVASAYLWTFAVERTCEIERREAAIAVAIPTAVYAVWILIGAL